MIKRKKELTVAFIVARLSSSRFPGKQLRKIGSHSILDWVLKQLKNSREIDRIVLATVAEPENLPLKNFAEENRIACFWYDGHVDHVTTRLRRAAEAYEADICVLVSADCPLIHAPSIDTVVRALKKTRKADTAKLSVNIEGDVPALEGIIVSRKKAWQLADDLADRPELKEHQFPLLGQRPDLFHSVEVRLPEFLYMPHHRLSVDTLADLEFMNALFHKLKGHNLDFELPNAVALLKVQPELRNINAHVHQRRLVEDIKKVLFIVDSGDRFGFGHLARSLELARLITERLGWPAHFMVDDQTAETVIQAAGHKTHWGAFGRPSYKDTSCHDSPPLESIFNSYNLLIFDIYDQREPAPDWRSQIPPESICVTIENTLPWACETDMIILPNLLGKKVEEKSAFTPLDPLEKRVATKVISGKSYLILRKEIRNLAENLPAKEIDVLAYLHNADLAAALKKRLITLGLKVKVRVNFATGFALDLARSKLFISGFGVSFNEALALSTLPVCLPDSKVHREDAERFYHYLGIPPLIIESLEDIERVIPSLLTQNIKLPHPIQDGTPNIVAEIAKLFTR